MPYLQLLGYSNFYLISLEHTVCISYSLVHAVVVELELNNEARALKSVVHDVVKSFSHK